MRDCLDLLVRSKFDCNALWISVLSAILVGCSAAPYKPVPDQYELTRKIFSEAKSVHLVVNGSPLATLENSTSEIIAAFGFTPAAAGFADLNIVITLSGEPYQTSFDLQKMDRMGGLHETNETVQLDVGYIVEGNLEIHNNSKVLKSYKLYSAEYGPQLLVPADASRIFEAGKTEALRKVVGYLCEDLLSAFPDRVPIDLIENGADENQKRACLEQLHSRSVHVKRVIEALLVLDSKPELTARAIRAIRQADQYDFHARFPVWLADPEPSIQLAAAQKLVALNSNVSRINTTQRMYKKEGLLFIDRANWLLDSIDDVGDEARLVLARGATFSVLPEIQANEPGSEEWQRWCDLQRRIDELRASLAHDSEPAIREAVVTITPVYETACAPNTIK